LPKKNVLAGLAPWVVGFAAILALVFWQPWHKAEQAPPAEATPASKPAATPLSEARQLVARARGLFEVLDATRDDFKLAEDLLAQAEAKDATDPEVWAAVAQLDQWYSLRGWDTSNARREAARTAAQRALRLDPQSFEVRMAQTGLLSDFGHEGVEKEKLLLQLRQERPRDQRVLRNLATTMDRQGQVDESSALLDESAALPGGDPLALYDKSLNLWFVGRTVEAETAIRAAIAQKPFAGALLISSWYQTVLHGDLAGARATLDRIPSVDFQEDRAAFFGYYVEYLHRDTDAALARLNAVPRDWLRDAWYSGPKSELIGDTLHHGGRGDAAVTEWRAALKLVESRLEIEPANRGLIIHRAQLLANLGEREEAGRQFSVLLQMGGLDPAGLHWVPRWVTQICIALDRKAEAIQQIANSLKSERHAVDYTTATLRLDPTLDTLRGEPAFQRLITEAEAIEQASSRSPPAKVP
jgi:tetratricopeptide (TPR) repeat protein